MLQSLNLAVRVPKALRRRLFGEKISSIQRVGKRKQETTRVIEKRKTIARSLFPVTRDFNGFSFIVIPIGITGNILVGQLIVLLKLPLYLDSIGTVFVAVSCGPWAGGLTGILSIFIWGLAIDPSFLPWWPVNFFIGFVAGLCANVGLFKSWRNIVMTGFLVALTAAIVSVPIAVYLYGGITGSGSSLIIAYLRQTGQGILQAVFSTNFLVEPVDKITTTMLAFVITQAISRRFIGRFPRSENVEIEASARRQQLYIAISIFALLIIFATFMLRNILGT